MTDLLHKRSIQIGVGVLMTVLIYRLGYQLSRSEFYPLVITYATFFGLYVLVCQYVKNWSAVRFFLLTGIFLRLVLLFSLPNLSDDLYRFIWDGRLLNQGINPFDHLPFWYAENGFPISGLTAELYQQLNSPQYFTIYPPVNQLIFATATALFPTSVWGSSLMMKSFLLIFEIGSIFLIIKLLRTFTLPLKNALWYVLNPLIIIEIVGNIHFEGAMIFFLLLAVWLLIKQSESLTECVTEKYFYHNSSEKGLLTFSAVAFALSVASKLLPLMFLPYFVKRVGGQLLPKGKINWRTVTLFFFSIGLTLILLFIPLFNSRFIQNFGDSLNLYFQKFEFNASLYYVLRWIGFQIKGYNIIGTLGPLLASVTMLTIVVTAWMEKRPNWQGLFEKMLLAITVYLCCTTTLHPWYLSLPIVFCVFTRFRFPIVWSGVIFLTYINYSYGDYYENLWMVGLEYTVVFSILLWELFSRKILIKGEISEKV